MRNNTITSWLLLLSLALLWGGAFLLIKLGLEYFTSLQVALMRVGFGALALSPLAIIHFRQIDKKMLKWVVFSGFLGSLLPAYLFAMAEQYLSSGIAGILSSLTPLFTVIFGATFFRQRIKNSEVSGLFLAFVGAILLIITSDGSLTEFSIGHAFLVVLACGCYALNINLIKHKLAHVPSMAIASGSLVVVGILSWVALFFTDFLEQIQLEEARETLFYLFILGTTATGIALVMFNLLLKIASPLFASSVTYMIPVIAVFLGVFIRDELISYVQIACLGLILLGIYLINKKS